MKTIQTTAIISPEHQLTIQVPPDIQAGEYEIVLVLEAKPARKKRQPFKFPVDDYGPWPVELSLRREDMYGEFGR
ncbi:MAG: hypothetical protein AB1589_08860 [Cyanobacteriota bacterium]